MVRLSQELIKQTDREDPERKALDRALEEMKDLSLYVNEVKRDNEALQLIDEIQNSISDLQMVRFIDDVQNSITNVENYCPPECLGQVNVCPGRNLFQL